MNNIPSDNMNNIVKIFNPFEILQPIKSGAVPKENLLVDISDDQHKDMTGDYNGSLLDRATKSEFDVVDLFQNMFINPEHINQNGKNLKELSEKEDSRDWIKDFDSIDYVNEVKVDVEKDLASIFSQPLKTAAVDVDDENKLIEEVLAMKRIDKELLRSHHRICIDNHKVSDNIKSLNLSINPEVYKVSGKCEDDQITITKESITFNNPTPEGILHENFHHCENYKIGNKNYLEKINEAAKASKSNFMVQAAKLDKKKYQKRQMLSDKEKVGYTKGPDLFEKSIALPPMIERIKVRQKYLEERNCRRHRLVVAPHNGQNIVHEGTSTTLMANVEKPVSLNPIVLTDDCNRDRLIAWKTRKAFQKFVLNEDH